MNILLGATGSVAALKYLKLFDELLHLGTVRGVLTDCAQHFVDIELVRESAKPPDKGLYKEWRATMQHVVTDHDEWQWNTIGDEIPHIELRDWADIFVIAPLSANTLAKMANGICDNLLTCVYRAWDLQKPIVIAPAMNTHMWDHPITKQQLNGLRARHLADNFREFGTHSTYQFLKVVNPVEKTLACGTTGMGAMAPFDDIVKAVRFFE